MLAFLSLPITAFGWLLFCLLCLIAAALFITAVVMLHAYLTPAQKRFTEGVVGVFDPGYRPCCPPGLGCNEDGRRTPCRRQLAYNLADPDETETLDTYWSAYHRHPSRSALRTWEVHRDTLIEGKLHHAGNTAQKKKLLGHAETTEIVSGEVLEPPRKRKSFPRPPGE